MCSVWFISRRGQRHSRRKRALPSSSRKRNAPLPSEVSWATAAPVLGLCNDKIRLTIACPFRVPLNHRDLSVVQISVNARVEILASSTERQMQFVFILVHILNQRNTSTILNSKPWLWFPGQPPLEHAFQVKVPCLTHYEETAQGLRACAALIEELSPASETWNSSQHLSVYFQGIQAPGPQSPMLTGAHTFTHTLALSFFIYRFLNTTFLFFKH